jgi:hypothetical protein
MKHIKTPLATLPAGDDWALFDTTGSRVARVYGPEVVAQGLAQAANERDDLIAQRDALVDACKNFLELAVWMSGSSSFSPEGEAHEGWLKMRSAISEGQVALALTKEDQCHE